jgi:hypothetical protein
MYPSPSRLFADTKKTDVSQMLPSIFYFGTCSGECCARLSDRCVSLDALKMTFATTTRSSSPSFPQFYILFTLSRVAIALEQSTESVYRLQTESLRQTHRKLPATFCRVAAGQALKLILN